MIYCNVSVLLEYIWTYNGGNLFLSPNIFWSHCSSLSTINTTAYNILAFKFAVAQKVTQC